jgi:putative methylase
LKQVNLEIMLSRLDLPTRSSYVLEQYPTPASIVAKVLYKAFSNGDIEGRVVADFGTGNGIFAIGASLLGAEKVYAIDKDSEVIAIAARNAERLECRVELINSGIEDFQKDVDTALMNPPFGRRGRNTDVIFIERAVELSKNFYIILNYKSGDFLRKFIGQRGEVWWEERVTFPIDHMFDFHRKERKEIEAKIQGVKVWKKNM